MKENIVPENCRDSLYINTIKTNQIETQTLRLKTKDEQNYSILQENGAQRIELSTMDEPAKIEEKVYPVPKGNSPYCLGKKAEQIEKNLKKAKFFYERAVQVKDRLPSAVKDLAGVLHSLSNTQQAINLLKKYEYLYYDKKKFNNLLESLKSQVNPTGNAINKIIKVQNVPIHLNKKQFAYTIFPDQNRIVKVVNEPKNECLFIHFNSHSGARKALVNYDGYQFPDLIVSFLFQLEWTDSKGVTQGPVVLRKKFQNDSESTASSELEGSSTPKQNSERLEESPQQHNSQSVSTKVQLQWHFMFAYSSTNFPFVIAIDQSCSQEIQKANMIDEQSYCQDYEKMFGNFMFQN